MTVFLPQRQGRILTTTNRPGHQSQFRHLEEDTPGVAISTLPRQLAQVSTQVRGRIIGLSIGLVLVLISSLSGCAPRAELPLDPLPPLAIAEPEKELHSSALAILAYLEAQDMARQDDYAGAREALSRAMIHDPSPFLSLELASFYWREGQNAETRAVLHRALEDFPGDQTLSSALVNAYLADDLVDEAIAVMETYLQRHPQDWAMRRNMAVLLLQYARFSHAADVLQAIPEAERTPDDLLLLAKSNAGLGQIRRTEELLLKALREDPTFLEALAELAFLYEGEGDLVQAEATYLRILDIRPDAEEILLRLIQVNIKLNQPEKALSFAMSQADQERFALEAALMFIRENLFQEARTVLDALPDEEGQTEADFYRALIAYDGDSDPEQALFYLGRIEENHPHFARALSFQGYLLLQLNRPDDALQVAREGRELFPNMSDFLLLEAEILLGEDQTEQAAALLETAREQWPGDPDVLYRLGYLLEQMGERDEALRVMEEIIAQDPDHAEALNFIGYTLAEEGRDLERALVLVERSLQLKPGSGHIIDSLAWVHYKLGNYEIAWRHIQSAVEIMSDDPIIWEHYGDIAAALGKFAEARRGYRNALRFQPEDPDRVQRKLDDLPGQ
ncbi:MAG: tetratricopeptide repeat protein [Desulfovibrionales bacterium]|nr:MAG: tetratricopeptide repeat protein [Desulfovibrionales bacterium]